MRNDEAMTMVRALAWSFRPVFLRALLTCSLALPWLWPFTYGPSHIITLFIVSGTCGLVALALLLTTQTHVTLRQAVPRAWLMAALVSAAFGVAQWFGFEPDSVLVSAADIGEAYGNLRQRNHFATLMTLGLIAILWMQRDHLSLWAVAAVILIAFANALSASRTGVLEWVIVGLLMGILPGPKRKRLTLCAIALAAYFTAAVFFPQVLLQWQGISPLNALQRAAGEVNCSSRWVLWANVMELIAERPLTGWGWGELDFAHFSHLYDGPRFCDILDNAHNLPLHLAVELGLPFAVGTCVAFAGLIWRQRPWAETDRARQFAWCALVTIGVHSLLEYPLWYGPFQLTVLLCFGLLYKEVVLSRRVRGGLIIVTLFGLCLLNLVWRDYALVSQAYFPSEQRRSGSQVDPLRVAGGALLFDSHFRFAELFLSDLSLASAGRVQVLALSMLHFSPEPSVIEKLLDSSLLLRDECTAAWARERYRAAFPQQYQAWALRSFGPNA